MLCVKFFFFINVLNIYLCLLLVNKIMRTVLLFLALCAVNFSFAQDQEERDDECADDRAGGVRGKQTSGVGGPPARVVCEQTRRGGKAVGPGQRCLHPKRDTAGSEHRLRVMQTAILRTPSPARTRDPL